MGEGVVTSGTYTICLDALRREALLRVCEPVRRRGPVREDEDARDGDRHGHRAFDDEEPSPGGNPTRAIERASYGASKETSERAAKYGHHQIELISTNQIDLEGRDARHNGCGVKPCHSPGELGFAVPEVMGRDIQEQRGVALVTY